MVVRRGRRTRDGDSGDKKRMILVGGLLGRASFLWRLKVKYN